MLSPPACMAWLCSASTPAAALGHNCPRRRKNWEFPHPAYLQCLSPQGSMRAELQGHCTGWEALWVPGECKWRKDFPSVRTQRIKVLLYLAVLKFPPQVKHHLPSKTTVVMVSMRAKGDRRIVRWELPTPSLPNPDKSFSEHLTAPST